MTNADPAPLLMAPAGAGDDDAFMALVDWLAGRGFALYPHQEEAMLELFSGRHVVLATPTGSGKSLVALALHFRALCRGERTVYTAPIKALANEKFFELCKAFGPENVGLLTGDASVNKGAPILCCTAEILMQMALEADAARRPWHVAMDEFHYYADRDRGMAWQVPLLRMEAATFLLMSATLGDMTDIARELTARTGKAVAHVTTSARPVPLEYSYLEQPLHEVVDGLVKAGKAPCYLVHFSHRDASETAGALMSVDVCSKDEKRSLAEALRGERWPSPYGKTLQRLLRHGIGLHHAGLLPRYRRLVERLAQAGLLKVVCGTDTLGIGINVPLKTVVLTRLCKYDGANTRIVQVRELHQIAGRAGRKGFDDQGWVVALAPEHVVANKRMENKLGRDGRKVNFVRQKPPEKGYAHWDEATFWRLVRGQPETLQPVFQVTAGLLAQVLRGSPSDAAPGFRTVVDLIGRCHLSEGGKLGQRRELGRIGRSLFRVGVLGRDRDDPRTVRLNAELQEDFSLHHALSLFLVYCLEKLDLTHLEQFGDVRREDDREPDPTDDLWAADVLSATEAILDNPVPVLAAQVREEKGKLVNELKAQGVPYEERMERLEAVTWPKPLADWLYARLDEFTAQHPWLEAGAVRPKAVARVLYEQWATFDEAVRDWGVEPAEGVLLRYLSDTYKALLQNVPGRWRSPAVWQAIGYLRALLAATDSSLVEEWESMRDGRAFSESGAEASVPLPERRATVHVVRDPKALKARLRAEMLQLCKALLAADVDALADAAHWSSELTPEDAVAWRKAQGAVFVFDHRMRLADHCQVRQVGAGIWEAVQTLFDCNGASESRVVAAFDASANCNAAVLLHVREIDHDPHLRSDA
ncbi:MAG: DUF3516 domain-containing protein [Deltaproteobacteria bacterium]|nr:DUF3516 domain-containing protein [Deltaproteobacteria bacterium]